MRMCVHVTSQLTKKWVTVCLASSIDNIVFSIALSYLRAVKSQTDFFFCIIGSKPGTLQEPNVSVSLYSPILHDRKDNHVYKEALLL